MNIMMKPVSGHCNVDCRYCFYKKEHSCLAAMTAADACAMLSKLEKYLHIGCPLVFQGGEPLLAGYDFYAAILDHLCKLGFNGQVCIQTNGTLLDEPFAALFAKHHVLLGVSLDGDEASHSVWRSDYAKVMRGIDCLRKSGCGFNILTVVTDEIAARIDPIYAFYKAEGFDYQQYIPCMDAPGEKMHTFLHSQTYADFLIRLFRLWKADITGGRQIYIRLFENLLQILAGYQPEDCGAGGVCTRQVLLEADGSVYPCDFYVEHPYLLGNILKDSYAAIEASGAGLSFMESSWKLPQQCSQCRWLNLCRGGCKRYRDEQGLFIHCAAYRQFFRTCMAELAQMQLC